jgi:hypothetical protein
MYRWSPLPAVGSDLDRYGLYKSRITKDGIAFVNSIIRPMGEIDE